jgi:AraC family transcriptional regulator of adaptative response / DNA-3-methyladenine glycosylase II
MLRFLEARAMAGVEIVAGESYIRVVEIDGATVSIHVSHAPENSALQVTVRFARLHTLPAIIARIRRMFDLSAEPTAIESALSCDPMLAPLVAARPGLRVPGAWEPFEIAVRAVLGQQISVRAATQLAGRIVAAVGTRVSLGIDTEGVTHAFPSPQQLNLKALSGVGLTNARTAAIAGIAAAAAADSRLFDPRRDLAEAVAHLRKLPGVGEWTAQYIAMRALGESDAFLADDLAIRRAFNANGRQYTTTQIKAYAERWRPWRAYALMHLWMADAEPQRAQKGSAGASPAISLRYIGRRFHGRGARATSCVPLPKAVTL